MTVALNKVVYKLVKVATSHCIGYVNANVQWLVDRKARRGQARRAAATQFLRSSRGDDDDTVGTGLSWPTGYLHIWIGTHIWRD